jgi:hypothetical protein
VEQTFCNLALTSLASFGDFMEYQRFHWKSMILESAMFANISFNNALKYFCKQGCHITHYVK